MCGGATPRKRDAPSVRAVSGAEVRHALRSHAAGRGRPRVTEGAVLNEERQRVRIASGPAGRR